MRFFSLCLVAVLLVGVPDVKAQSDSFSKGRWEKQAKRLTPIQGGSVVSNFIQIMAAGGDSLWHGPLLSVYVEDAPEGQRFLTVDDPTLTEEENVVFALDVVSDPLPTSTIWAGLAFSGTDNQPTAGGLLVSTDGGANFSYLNPPLDAPGDTTIQYGSSTLTAIPITEPSGAAPQDIDVDEASGTTWLAGARRGLRRTTDGGQTWSRVVLPPDSAVSITPDDPNDFTLGPPLNDGRGNRNHFVFSTLVDETGTVWAGTAAGINRSRPQDVINGERAWLHIIADGTRNFLTGNSVVRIQEQPTPGRNPVWIASWALDQTDRFGVTVTTDGGQTYRQTLLGERVYDFAFRGDRVYAAAEDALYRSEDGGRTWISQTTFQPEDGEPDKLPRDLGLRAVVTTPRALWLGTTDGLLRSTNEGRTWQIFRTSAPVNPDDPTDEAPDVATYAYPNPFSPASDEFTRIRYETEGPTSVEINIYDFSMNRVRTIRDDVGQGQVESTWDGTDEGGLRLPNGTYFYTVDTGRTTVRGKILLLE
ncbi:hypothetical protein CRI94_04975 [Longibacter salinarum]|uniref:FlgD/Vpr Ig-like domain-containing protein n=1 Tax=Longibacter salinarum TaxID=1850348 RepID=A0A2A8D082_9BACT|nr:FlgD immunoglobulin-like domain containing protein [Longibacter salinarum]PEN14389.1 hypothetical protein CRI94_04975 [Longibacter salinarum]